MRLLRRNENKWYTFVLHATKKQLRLRPSKSEAFHMLLKNVLFCIFTLFFRQMYQSQDILSKF